MWLITVRSPDKEPREFVIEPGSKLIGRRPDADICLLDESASRTHAELRYQPEKDELVLVDKGSRNGTFVNHDRISQPRALRPGDEIRVGQHILIAAKRETHPRTVQPERHMGTRQLTRDLVMESVDHHAVLLYEVASRLNTIIDLDTALREAANLIKVTLGADKCQVILSERLGQLREMGFPTEIARQAIEQQSAIVVQDAQSDPNASRSALLLRIRSALCVPVVSNERVYGIIYVYKTRPDARRFDQRDMQLVVAISHQTALTIQRDRLLERFRQEQRGRTFLQRFLSPQEAEYLLQDYLKTGRLPELTEQTLTVLFADMSDSTGLAERLGARRFSDVLSRYYQEMTEVVFEHGGLLNKYLGDGLMAVFGVTKRKPNPEECAVQAGLKMLDHMAAINRDMSEDISIGVGINTGTVVAGYLGTEERIEFTVLGDPVNVAAGLEALARPNRVFVGQDTYERVTDRFEFAPIGNIDLKRRTKPIGVFEARPSGAAGSSEPEAPLEGTLTQPSEPAN
jgi:adenylate cyclase